MSSSEDEVERGGEYDDSKSDLGRRELVDTGFPRDETGGEGGSNEIEYVCMVLC